MSGNITSLDNFALRLASDLRINKETIIKMQMSVSVALLKELMTFSINDRDTELDLSLIVSPQGYFKLTF